jgi:hypothetical protein
MEENKMTRKCEITTDTYRQIAKILAISYAEAKNFINPIQR